ncbi:MAG TPA: preprotein translocase subunit SecE [Candidatus Saccharimonadales bacterium]|nr:preprotein translocase subunit SecE [Candidatus Saccharimonadales bacterium]
MKFAPINFINGVVDEGKKTIWPNRDTVIRHSLMVVITLAVATLIFAGVDYLLQKLLLLAINR